MAYLLLKKSNKLHSKKGDWLIFKGGPIFEIMVLLHALLNSLYSAFINNGMQLSLTLDKCDCMHTPYPGAPRYHLQALIVER